MQLASIDIGSNTILLLIADFDGTNLEILHEEQRIPRLARDVDQNRTLSENAVERAITVLKEYREIIEDDYPDVVGSIVTATSAVRDSANREEFKSQVKQHTGFDVQILSGREEAAWTYRGALSIMDLPANSKAVTLDIGGGSTEMALGTAHNLINYHSFDIGSVRYTERFINADPPDKAEIKACKDAIAIEFAAHPFSWQGSATAVGVAGTVTSLAYMEAGLEAYDPRKLNGMKMTVEQVEQWVQKLSAMRTDSLIEQYPEVMKGRADVFLAGILILEFFLKQYHFSEFLVSTGGIRHGAVLQLYQNYA